jgi:hypothetical protein
VLGPITAIPQGVTFSLNCQFIPQPTAPAAEGAAEAPAADTTPSATPAGT